MRNDDEEERHERKMIWLARGIIFLAVAWFFAMFGPGLFALIYALLDLSLTYAIAYWLDV